MCYFLSTIVNQLKAACGTFSRHHFVGRGQKAWFLPAALNPT
jgi:hypothetical protein